MILVTGCAGFIGSKVAERLLGDGQAVVGVDNENSAYDTRMKDWRLDRLKGRPGFLFRHLDITDEDALHALFSGGGATYPEDGQESAGPGVAPFDAVINLAARAGVVPSVNDPGPYYSSNVTGALNLLEMCRQFGVRKFIQASTSSVYGAVAGDGGDGGSNGPPLQPFGEDMPTDRPMSPYAASKKASEVLAYTYSYLHGLDVTVLRFFTVYGPAGRPDMSIFRFVKWIAEGEPLMLNGDGTQLRDFTYVDDIARGACLALNRRGYDVINLGSDRPVSIRAVIGQIENLLERKASIERHPPRPADVPATWADISRAREVLGWEPEVSLEEGLRRAVDWYRENRAWAREIRL